MRQGDHLLVGGGPVEEVLGDAEVRVEHRRGQLRVLARRPELTAEPVEPLTPVVGDHALQGDDSEQEVGRSRPEGQRACPIDCCVRAVEITGEVGEHPPPQQDGTVVGATTGLQPGQRLLSRGEVPTQQCSAGHPCPQARRLVEVGRRQCLAVGRHGGMVTDRGQRIRAQRQQLGLRTSVDVLANGAGPPQHLLVEPGCRRGPRRLQRVRSGHGRSTPARSRSATRAGPAPRSMRRVAISFVTSRRVCGATAATS